MEDFLEEIGAEMEMNQINLASCMWEESSASLTMILMGFVLFVCVCVCVCVCLQVPEICFPYMGTGILAIHMGAGLVGDPAG